MKKILAVLSVTFFVCLSFLNPSFARDFVPVGTDPSIEEKIAVMVKDRREGATWISVIQKYSENQKLTGNQWCRSLDSDACLDKTGVINGNSLLEACKAEERDCIESIAIYQKGQEPQNARLQTGVTKGHSFEGSPALGIPAGGQPSLWIADGVANSDGSEAYVVAVNEGWWSLNGSTAAISNFSAAVYPVVELSGPSYRPAEIQERLIDGVKWYNHDNGEQGTNDGCVLTDKGKCWARTEFSKDVRVKLTLRLTSKVSGWLHGRLADAEIKINAIDSMTSRVEIDAAPVEIPILYAEIQKASLSSDEEVLVTKWEEIGGFNNGKKWYIFDSDKPYANEILKAFREESRDTAAASQTAWMVTSLSSGQAKSPCLSAQGKLLGVVTTNALTYSGNTPEWRDFSLNYQVGGLHFSKNGELELGNYEMIIRSDAARCLYGFTNAPISATVTVVGTGDQNVASTVISERDGWLKLAAYGFTFSEKEIQVKLTQPQNKTLTKFTGSTNILSSKQKAEIKTVVTKAKGNPKFICTGVYVNAKDKVTALKRARAACDYAKSLDKNHSYFAQAKQSAAKSFDAKVMIVSK